MAVEAEIELLRSYGHQVTTLFRSNEMLDRVARHRQLRETLWSSQAVREISDLIRDQRPDLLHVHNTFPSLSPAIYWAGAAARVPIVQTLHNFRLLCVQAMFLREGRVCEACLGKLPWRGAVRKCYRGSLGHSAAVAGMLTVHRAAGSFQTKVSRYVALSEFSRDKFAAGGLPAEKISVKPNFVASPYAECGRRCGGLFVGRLSPEKGLHVLLAALQRLPGITVAVIGTGPQMHHLREHPQVKVLGAQSSGAVLEHMRQAAYLVMPSICYEQFPRTLVEAFACGLPVIASRLGSLAELIEHGRTGLLFEPGSASALADQLRFAAANRHLMQQMGKNARAEYEAKYTPERNHSQLMEIYSEAIETNISQ